MTRATPSRSALAVNAIAAGEEMERAMLAFAEARQAYGAACKALMRGAYDEAAPRAGGRGAEIAHAGVNAQFALTAQIGTERLDKLLAARLRGLGLEGLFSRRRSERSGPDWFVALSERLRRLT